ncbi:RNA polymerase factor sigma-54 [Pacificimonas sp. ICDLI1SI03]
MALGPRLDLRQTQSLVMTPQLQQAIKLLALSNMELETFLQDELEKNPLLEMQESESGETKGEAPAETAGSDELMMSGGGDGEDAPLDMDVADTFHHDGPSDMPEQQAGALDGGLSLNGTAPGAVPEDAIDIGEAQAAGKSLHEVLIEQTSIFDQVEAMVARHIIDLIDDSGYFTGSCEEIGWRLDMGEAAVEAVLLKIQTFEPTGVGARDLGECLALQAKEADRYDPCMAALLERLDLLARGELGALRRYCKVDADDLADMIQEIRQYNPKPGLLFGGGEAMPIVPDVFVAAKPQGGWKVEINSATLPRLLVNRAYAAELHSGGSRSKDTNAFLSECLQSANWLMNALDQRQRTIVRVASEIVKQQEAFFLEGVSRLKPLTLRAIAEEIEMHESTVSRVTSNKYLMCSRGLFELKYFFTSAIQSTAADGDAVSAEAVKSRIAALIGSESPKKVLSDDKLVTLLNEDGFDIARRTVAKYREALGLGSSVQRRRSYALEGNSGRKRAGTG